MVQALKKRAQKLRNQITNHNHSYYVLDNPSVTDVEYDKLFQELLALELENPELLTADSPTQRVGGEPAKGFTQVEHSLPMLSLGNAFNRGDLENWLRRTKN